MELNQDEKRRRARNVAWMVGGGLLLVNILIGYPSCSGDEASTEAAPSEAAASEPGGATED